MSHLTHDWDLTPKVAVALQKELRSKVRIEPWNGGKYRIPTSTRLADQWVNRIRRGEAETGVYTI